MDPIVGHLQAYLWMYIALTGVMATIGGFILLDIRSARRVHGRDLQNDGIDHERSVHIHHPWAGMDESGPAI